MILLRTAAYLSEKNHLQKNQLLFSLKEMWFKILQFQHFWIKDAVQNPQTTNQAEYEGNCLTSFKPSKPEV